MPPIKKISKEDIIKAGYEIVEESGMDALNARDLAKKLNCSVQPLFSNFENMDSLKNEVLNYCYKKYIEYMKLSKDYKDTGIRYIRFAKIKPNVFKAIFTIPSNRNAMECMINDESFKIIADNMKKMNNFTDEMIKDFHLKMWLFTQGIVSLILNHTCSFSDEEIELLLVEQYLALMNLMKLKTEFNLKSLEDYENLEVRDEKN